MSDMDYSMLFFMWVIFFGTIAIVISVHTLSDTMYQTNNVSFSNNINNPLTKTINNNYKPMSNNSINNPLAKAVNDYYNNKQKDYNSLFIGKPRTIEIPSYMQGFLKLQKNTNNTTHNCKCDGVWMIEN